MYQPTLESLYMTKAKHIITKDGYGAYLRHIFFYRSVVYIICNKQAFIYAYI